MVSRREPRWRANQADREALMRAVAARVVLDAIICGELYADPAALKALSRLVDAAARWAELAEGEVAA